MSSTINQTAPTCPRCRGEMTLRSGSRGSFYSCKSYPSCRGSIDAAGLGGAPVAARASPPPPLGVPPNAYPIACAPGFSSDPYQQAVIDWREGWAVCAAAAGSGKSYSAIMRVVSLLSEGVVPEAICLLAFNASAAELLRTRLAASVGPAAKRCQIMTFHAWSYALLRHWHPGDPRFLHGHLLGGADGPHPIKLAIPICNTLSKEYGEDISFGAALRTYERFSESLLSLSEVNLATVLGYADPAGGTAIKRAEPLVRFLRMWAEEKRKRDLIDFTDMLCEVARAISWQPEAPHVRALRTMYQHVTVDEVQDTSLPRAIISQWLGQGARSFLAIGDCRQSIAKFAGARLDLFIQLATSPGVTLLPLPVNRRSSQRIVEAANEVARGREWNLGGDCIPRDDAPEGEPVQVWDTDTPAEEASRVISDIQRRVAHGLPLEVNGVASYCCVARTNAMLVELEYAFVARSIPVRVAGSAGGIWGSSVGQELLAYLEGSEGVPTFNLLSVLNKPKRFGKKADLGEVVERAQAREKEGRTASLIDNLRASPSRALQRFGSDLQRAAGQKWPVRCLTVARWLGLDEDGEDEEAGEDRRAALEALLHLAQQLGSLKGVYDYKQAAAKGEREPAVVLSTIHARKGLEHPVIYACGVRVGKLPHLRAVSDEEVEEERRLLYVAVTRARDVLVVSSGGAASRFLTELGWVTDCIRSAE